MAIALRAGAGPEGLEPPFGEKAKDSEAQDGEAAGQGVEAPQDDALDRFLRPRVDVPSLVLEDILVAGIVAPSVAVFLLVPTGIYVPGWLISGGAATRGLLAPTLSHGAGLACCWVLGALAGRTYEREALDPRDLAQALRRTLLAGAFATALLILATQAQLRLSGAMPLEVGRSPEEDFLLLRTTADLLIDVSAEAVVIVAWRLARARGLGGPPPPPG